MEPRRSGISVETEEFGDHQLPSVGASFTRDSY